MSKDTVGREPVQIIEVTFPKCANTHGTAPCTAVQTGDDKCFNTYATCNDVVNFRAVPEGGIATTPLAYKDGETILAADLVTTADVFIAVDVSVPLNPTGTILELGGSGDGVYLGITGSNLIFRAGDGSAADTVNTAKISTPLTNIEGETLTLLAEIDFSADSVTLWKFNPCNLTLTQLGTDVAASGFDTQWSGGSDGTVGNDDGTLTVGEDGGDWSGVIDEVRIYNSTAKPDMTDDFKSIMYFGRKQQAKPSDAITIYPMVTNVSTVGSRISLASSERDYSPLGGRASVTIAMSDGLGSDLLTDPYLSNRTYAPLNLATFWTKLWIRQKFGKLGARVRIYEGYDGEALSAMRVREYSMDRLDLQGRDGVSIYCRDILTRSELKKAQAPEASPGVLDVLLTVGASTAVIAGMVISDYDASGTLRINEECMTYSAIADNGDGTFDFTLTLRGTDGTTADEHDIDDAVQLCLRYNLQRVDTVLENLLGDFAGIEYQLLNLTAWESETTSYLTAYQLTTLITEPTEVKTLVGELAEQCSFYIWWDEQAQLVDMRAIRGLTAEPATLNENAHFIESTVTFREKPEERVSQVWIYYNQSNPTEALDFRHNYINLYIDANLELEGPNQYRQKQIRTIFSRWLPTNAQVTQTSSRIAARYEEVPVEMTFMLDEKDDTYIVGSAFKVNHHLLVDANGNNDTSRIFIILEMEPLPYEGKFRYIAQDITLTGFIYVIVDNAEGDYVGDGTDQFDGGWISDSNGLYSNGDRGARIS